MTENLIEKMKGIVQEVEILDQSYWDIVCYLTDAQNIINSNQKLIAKIFKKHIDQYDLPKTDDDNELIAKHLTQRYLSMPKVTQDVLSVCENLQLYTWNDLKIAKNDELCTSFRQIMESETEFWDIQKEKMDSLELKAEISDAFDEFLWDNSYIYYFFEDFSYLITKVGE